MPKKWMDISIGLKSGMVHWPSDPGVVISRVADMHKGARCNISHINMGSHTGTHMDAPLHFLKDGVSLDKMPLDATVGSARVIEIKDRNFIRADELKKYKLKKGERILFKTANSKKGWRSDEFMTEFVHIPAETAQYLAKTGVRTIGVDYLSVGGYKKDGRQTHEALLGAGIWLIEGLDLSKVTPGRYQLICLPLKILNADGAPARAILGR